MRNSFVLLIVTVSCLTIRQIDAVTENISADPPPSYFNLTLIAPSNNPTRVEHAQLITQKLWMIGIDAELVLIAWEPFEQRLFNSVNFEGYGGDGFDIGFIDRTANPTDPAPLEQFYHSRRIDKVAGADNYYPINSTKLDELIDLVDTELNFETRREYVRQALDIVLWDYMPTMGLYQAANPFALEVKLRGFDAFRWGQPNLHVPELFYEDTQNIFKYASNARFINLNPALSTSYYDNLIHQPTQAWTYQRDAAMRFRAVLATREPMPVGSDEFISEHVDITTITADSPYANATVNTTWGPHPTIDPQFSATKRAEDYSMFLVNLRNDIPWHPGYGYTADMNLTVTVDDFQWTLSYLMDEDLASPHAQDFEDIYGSQPAFAIQKINKTMMKISIRGPRGDGRYSEWYDALALRPLPQHVLDPAFNATPYGGKVGVTPDGTIIANYSNHYEYAFNTGARNSALVGCGAYYFESWDDVESIAVLQKFDDWGGSWRSETNLWDYPAYSGNNIDTYAVTVYSSKESAEIALINGDIDGIDVHFQMGPDIPYLQTKPNVQVILIHSSSIESMGYNSRHPTLSNRYVRLAIAHMVPAQKIVNEILSGLGSVNELVGIALANPYMPYEEEFQLMGLDVSENVVDPETGETLEFQEHIRYNIHKAWALMEKAGYDMASFRAIVDTTPPSISSPSDITYKVGETGSMIIWSVADASPAGYNIIQNGILVANGTWSNGTITFDIKGLAEGNYMIRLNVWDSNENTAYDEVVVNVVRSSSSKPSAMIPGLQLLITFIALAVISVFRLRISRFREK